MENYFTMTMTKAQVNEISSLGLAHIGDGVYELLCRAYLCNKGGKKVGNLHKNAIKMVNAVYQAGVAEKLLPHLTEEEQDYFKTRDVLMVHGLIDGEHFAFYVAHLPSRSGDKKGSNQLRDRGGEIMYEHAVKMMEKYPGIKIVCMGDMNDNPTDPSMAEYLHGKENLEDVGELDF